MTARTRLAAVIAGVAAAAAVALGLRAGLSGIFIGIGPQPGENAQAPLSKSSESTPVLPINLKAAPHTPAAAERPRPYTNEALQEFLEQDKKRMGIKKIYSQDEIRALKPPKNPEKDRQREADRAKIRAMARAIQTALEAKKKRPVVLHGNTPKLLSEPADADGANGSPIPSSRP